MNELEKLKLKLVSLFLEGNKDLELNYLDKDSITFSYKNFTFIVSLEDNKKLGLEIFSKENYILRDLIENYLSLEDIEYLDKKDITYSDNSLFSTFYKDLDSFIEGNRRKLPNFN